MHFIEKFDRENINRWHLRPPVLALLLEIIGRENFYGFASIASNRSIFPHQKIAQYGYYVATYVCLLNLISIL